MDNFKGYRRNPKAYIALLIILLSLVQTSLIFDSNLSQLVLKNRIVERGFVSMRIAQNIADGRGETFDTIHGTSGNRPLWVWSMVPIFKIINDPSTAALVCWMLLELLFHAALIIIFAILSKKIEDLSTFTAVALFLGLFPGIKIAVIDGLDTPLFLFIFAVVALYFGRIIDSRGERLRIGDGIIAGALLSMLFYARLDSFIIAFVFAGAVISMRDVPGRSKARFLGVAGATGLVCVLPYFIRNVLLYRHVVPLSSVVERWHFNRAYPGFASFFDSMEWTGAIDLFQKIFSGGANLDNRWINIGILIFVCFFVLAAVIYAFKRKDNFIKIVSVYCVAHLLLLLLFYRQKPIQPNDFIIEFMAIAVFIVLLLDWVFKKLFTKKIGGLVFLLLIAALALWETSLEDVNSPRRTRERVAVSFASMWIDEYLPKDALFGSFEPGAFSFMSQQRVVDLGGANNDEDFFEEYLKKDRIAEYILESDIRYLIDRFDGISVDNDGTISIEAHPSGDGARGLIKSATLEKMAPNLRIVQRFSGGLYIFEKKLLD